MDEDGLATRLDDFIALFLSEDSLTLDDGLVAFDGDDFAGILVDEILIPLLEDTCCELSAHALPNCCFADLNLVGEAEDL